MSSFACTLLAALVAFVPTLPAQERSEQDTDAFVRERFEAIGAPGMSVAVVRGGQVVFAKGYGSADLENDVAMTPEHVFRIGSVTKPFTATMVMQLVNEGKLRLDQPVREVLPELPEGWAAVTVRQLLDHTSGIKSCTGLPNFGELSRRPVTPAGIVATVQDEPFDFEPGTGWAYNNTGYVILGMLVEKVDGRSFAESLRERVTRPLGMDQTFFVSEADIVSKRARGYSLRDGATSHAEYLDMGWPFSAGAMESTVLDLAKWDAALYGDKLLPQDTLEAMWSRTRLPNGDERGYGLGWALAEANGARIVQHSGGIPGFLSVVRRAPEKRLTVIVLVNSDSVPPEGLAEGLMGFIDPSLAPPVPVAEIDTDPEATARDRQMFVELLDDRLDDAAFMEEAAKVITSERRRETAAQFRRLGELGAFEFLSARSAPGATVREYRVTLGKTRLKVTVAREPGGRIAGLKFGA